jgi:hypothetical protein
MWWIDLEPIHPDVFTDAVRFMPILIGSSAQTTSILKSDWLTSPILINIMRPRLLNIMPCRRDAAGGLVAPVCVLCGFVKNIYKKKFQGPFLLYSCFLLCQISS